jgi:cellulose synthase/poly-beta-1,6-N-acetylglucosamine synthase-like glycosyltransferase
MLRISFYASLFILFYTWLGYFLLLALLAKFYNKKWKQQNIYPSITILLTVHNEEKLISKRLDNLLSQDYPVGLFEVLVASDGSTDKTNKITGSFIVRDKRIRLYVTSGGGKSATQNSAVPLAKNDVIVLTDADTLFETDTVKQIAKNFADKRVGCVSGRLELNRVPGSVAENQGSYWKFEMALRRMESQIGVMHTATGQVMAFRKDLFRHFDPKYGDDCIIPLDILEQGYRVVHDDEAIAYDSFPSSVKGELRARTRMTLRNITCTLSKYRLLNPFRHPGLCWAIISHKILRWLTPFFMLAALVSNVFLVSEGTFYLTTGVAQALFYLLGLVGLVGQVFKIRIPLASQIFSFLLANTGFLLGVLQAAAGRHVTAYRNKETCQGA